MLIGLEQGILGLFVAELGAHSTAHLRSWACFFALHGVGSAIVTGSALIGWLEKRNNKRIAMASLALGAGGFLVVFGESWTLKLVAAPLLGIGFGGLSMFQYALRDPLLPKKCWAIERSQRHLRPGSSCGAVAGQYRYIFRYRGVPGHCCDLTVVDDRRLGRLTIASPVTSPTFASEDSGASRVALTRHSDSIFEAGLTYWMPSLLAETSDNELIGASYMAAFFGWFVVVRLGAAALAMWITTLGFALIGLGGVFASLLLVSTGFIPLSETSFIGAFMGLIFPNAYAWMLMTGHGGTALRR